MNNSLFLGLFFHDDLLLLVGVVQGLRVELFHEGLVSYDLGVWFPPQGFSFCCGFLPLDSELSLVDLQYLLYFLVTLPYFGLGHAGEKWALSDAHLKLIHRVLLYGDGLGFSVQTFLVIERWLLREWSSFGLSLGWRLATEVVLCLLPVLQFVYIFHHPCPVELLLLGVSPHQGHLLLFGLPFWQLVRALAYGEKLDPSQSWLWFWGRLGFGVEGVW